jgi:hypothetical protein
MTRIGIITEHRLVWKITYHKEYAHPRAREEFPILLNCKNDVYTCIIILFTILFTNRRLEIEDMFFPGWDSSHREEYRSEKARPQPSFHRRRTNVPATLSLILVVHGRESCSLASLSRRNSPFSSTMSPTIQKIRVIEEFRRYEPIILEISEMVFNWCRKGEEISELNHVPWRSYKLD